MRGCGRMGEKELCEEKIFFVNQQKMFLQEHESTSFILCGKQYIKVLIVFSLLVIITIQIILLPTSFILP